MNHVHFVTLLHRYIVSVYNKFRKNLPALKAWAVDFHRNRNAVYRRARQCNEKFDLFKDIFNYLIEKHNAET
jgi:hypothetical protein